MKTPTYPTIALAAGAIIVSSFFSQSATAQSIVIGTPGSSTLAANNSVAADALTVSWDVTKSGSTYTYSYDVSNPAGSGSSVSYFSVDFDAILNSTFSSLSGGNGTSPNGYNSALDVYWTFASALTAGHTSGMTLTFTSPDAPVLGGGDAIGTGAATSWSTSSGNQLPVPSQVPEPATTSLLLLSAGAMFSRIFKK
jgi:hypothetical protein